MNAKWKAWVAENKPEWDAQVLEIKYGLSCHEMSEPGRKAFLEQYIDHTKEKANKKKDELRMEWADNVLQWAKGFEYAKNLQELATYQKLLREQVDR